MVTILKGKADLTKQNFKTGLGHFTSQVVVEESHLFTDANSGPNYSVWVCLVSFTGAFWHYIILHFKLLLSLGKFVSL